LDLDEHRSMMRRLANDDDGGVFVEATIVMTIILVLVLGGVDFLLAFYQWNAATKAVQAGVRIAAVSDPVAKGLNALTARVVTATLRPGSAMPSFTVTCDRANATCTCRGACNGVAGYDAAAMSTIVFGRGSAACGDATSFHTAGMCDIFDRITPANVLLTYTQPAAPAGLGYAGRPGGPVPTIRISLQNLPFRFFFVGDLLQLKNVQIPGLTSTMAAEDLHSCAPTMRSGCYNRP
jgi:Flp pilus assembly protein TadG